MADPRTLLLPRFASALAAALGEEHRSVDPAIHRSERADLQADVAMALAKRLGKPPRDVAELIAHHLDVRDLCDKVEIAGPGFINLTLSSELLAGEVSALGRDPAAGLVPATRPERIVIDYSAPNVAKEMHVGHIRSTVIGDSLSRVLEALGHDVVRQNHLGDWGTQFGMLIEHLLDVGEAAAEQSIADLDAFYRQARAKFDGDPAFAERSRRRVVQLQGGDGPTLARWKVLTDASRRYFGGVYAKIRVKLRDEDVCGESFYNPLLPGVVAELQEKGLAVESDGAVCVFPAGFTARDGSPLPLIIRKSDGGFGYATTDLAAIRERTQTRRATRLLYVIGAPQQQHLAMVFAAARAAGWLLPPARTEHVSFGSILGPDKRPFKTREGGTVKLVALIDEAIARAAKAVAEKNPSLPAGAAAEVARQVGIGAIKYADLSSDRAKDYVFDWDRMLAFEGNTAPYIQYVHARVNSIFRRAEPADAEAAEPADVIVRAPAERALALELLSFAAAVESVADSLQPHRLCTYLFAVATRFNAFWEQCPVLKAEDAAVRHSRLALSAATAKVLARGLDLLGIEAPEQMCDQASRGLCCAPVLGCAFASGLAPARDRDTAEPGTSSRTNDRRIDGCSAARLALIAGDPAGGRTPRCGGGTRVGGDLPPGRRLRAGVRSRHTGSPCEGVPRALRQRTVAVGRQRVGRGGGCGARAVFRPPPEPPEPRGIPRTETSPGPARSTHRFLIEPLAAPSWGRSTPVRPGA